MLHLVRFFCMSDARIHEHQDLSRFVNYVIINLTSLLKPTQFLILSHCEILRTHGFPDFTSKFAFKPFLWLSH
jgi:hypothetical protein